MNLVKSLFGTSQGAAAGKPGAMSAKEAKARIDSDKSLLIVDVRQPDEYRSGHIPGARLIPLNDLSRKLGDLPRDREILCVCRSGARSGMAARQLAAAGYTVINLQGGMMGWQSAGFPVKRS